MNALSISYDKTIRSHFSNDQSVLICLFPFYEQVYADHYNWEGNLKNTYSLLRKGTWSKVSKEIGFNSLNRLAKGVLELESPFTEELNEYCQWKKIDRPHYAADRIPEVILLPLIRYIRSLGHKTLQSKSLDRFPDSEDKIVSFTGKDDFEIFDEVNDSCFLYSENGLGVLLTDYDCPYAILIGDKEACKDFVMNCDLECFEANQNTRFDWWNQ